MASTKDRLRRSMMFLSAQKPGLAKDAYIFGPDCVILDLEDAVAESQKDAARFSLYQILKHVDYGSVERVVRINGLDTEHWREDVRVCVAGGADAIRIAKCDTAKDVLAVEQAVLAAEEEFGVTPGQTLLMAALESPLGVLNAYEIACASPRMFGVAISGGDFRKAMMTQYQPSGIELLGARSNVLLAARAAGVQCFDTVFTRLDDIEGFTKEVILDKEMGFDGKSVVSPKQISIIHDIYAPTPGEIHEAERVVSTIRENLAKGTGIFSLDGKMLDIAFLPGYERVLKMARAVGSYKGDLV